MAKMALSSTASELREYGRNVRSEGAHLIEEFEEVGLPAVGFFYNRVRGGFRFKVRLRFEGSLPSVNWRYLQEESERILGRPVTLKLQGYHAGGYIIDVIWHEELRDSLSMLLGGYKRGRISKGEFEEILGQE